MRKLPLLLGTLGGAMAGYLFSNKKLRDQLSGSKNAEEAGKILAEHLQKDGKQIGAEVQKFVQSEIVQDNLGKAKKMAEKYAKRWKGDVSSYMKSGKKAAKSAMKKATAKSQAAQPSSRLRPAGKKSATKRSK